MGYLFDPDVLKECAAAGVGLPLEEAFDRITDQLAERYPGHIHTGPRDWIFNNAGGAKGVLSLLHGSVLEYLIFFGTDIGTHGHSGIYRADVYDWVFHGEMWCQEGQNTQRQVYQPGSQAHLGRGKVKYYRLPERGWMLEYARGPIVTMLPFGLGDSFSSTLDFTAIRKTITTYGKLCVKELLQGKI